MMKDMRLITWEPGMAIGLITLLISAGASMSWVAASWRPSRPATIEAISGALLIAGLALLGLSMPLAQHLTSG
jgi:hypothetical protein